MTTNDSLLMQISVIIPTYNEAANIGLLVQRLRTYGREALSELIVVDAHSPDGTAAVAEQAGATVLMATQPGRAAQMNLGAAHATGDVLYSVHADVGIHPDFGRDITEAVAQGYEAGRYRFQFDSPHPLLRFNSYSTRFGGLMSRGGDQTLFITRSLFDRLGGFDERFVIMEDFDMIRRICRITRFYVVPKSVSVSARKYAANSWLRVQVANLIAVVLFYLDTPPPRIARTYKSLLH